MRKSEILPKLAPHGAKRAFCALFLEIEAFSLFGDDLTSVRRSGEPESEIFSKHAPHGPKRAFCSLFLKIALFSRFGDDLRPLGRF